MIPSALLRQTAAIEPYAGEGATGPVFGEAATYPCRLLPRRRQVTDAQGQLVVSEAVCYLRTDARVGVSDRLTCDGAVYRVLSVTAALGLTGAEHLELTLGRSQA